MTQPQQYDTDLQGNVLCLKVSDLRAMWDRRADEIGVQLSELPQRGAKEERAALNTQLKAVNSLCRKLLVLAETDHPAISVAVWDSLSRSSKLHRYYGVSFDHLHASYAEVAAGGLVWPTWDEDRAHARDQARARRQAAQQPMRQAA